MSPAMPAKAGDAHIHLVKAEEFCAAASVALEKNLSDAAVANAVVAAIRASDTICCARLSRRWHGADHTGATALLSKAGLEGRNAATILARLLPKKNRAQYTLTATRPEDAESALDDSEEMLRLARQTVASLPKQTSGESVPEPPTRRS